MNSELRERFARRVPVRDIDRVPSGSPVRYVLRISGRSAKTVTAALALAKRHLSLAQAHRLMSRLLAGEMVAVEVPVVEDPDLLQRELEACSIIVERREAPEEVDVKSIRERLGLSQEEFAVRFGLDTASLRNWEQGRTRPEKAVRALFRVIERDPAAVERALSG
jgi:DNA-binding transcriptional regulator YiaG